MKTLDLRASEIVRLAGKATPGSSESIQLMQRAREMAVIISEQQALLRKLTYWVDEETQVSPPEKEPGQMEQLRLGAYT